MIEQVIDILSGVFLLLLSLASVKVQQYLKARIKNEQFQNATARMSEAVVSAVTSVQSRYVAHLKELSKDGKLTEEERDIARGMALEHAKSALGEEGKKVLAEVLGAAGSELDKVLSVEIEAGVHQLKTRGKL